MRKILFIVPFLSGGGAERVVSIWASELAKLGMDTHLLVFYRVSDEYQLERRVKLHNIKVSKEEYDNLHKIKKLTELRRKIKDINPDAVIPFITHVGIMTTIAKVGLNIKMIETIRINPYYSPKNRILRLLRDFSVFLSDYCIVQNHAQKEYFPKRIQRKLVIFHNPISKDFIKTKRINNYNEIKIIVSVGRLEKQKNYPMLIKAFAEVHTLNDALKLLIYGEGSLEAELRSLIYSLGLDEKVHLCGRVNNIKEVLAKSDLFILTSDSEGMPNALMEAMAVGLPCISTNCPTGPSDLIENGVNGLLIPVGDKIALVNAIKEMYLNPHKAFLMGEIAKKTILERYAPENSGKILYKFLSSI